MLITSKDNNKIKEVRKLLDRKYSKEKGLFVIEGNNLITEAYKNNLLVELYVLDGTKVDFDFECTYVTEDVMKTLSNLKSTPRVLGVSKYKRTNDLGNKIIVLDNLQDPGNAGTIIRNAVAFGIDTIIFSDTSVYPYHEKVLRSTGGMIFNINIVIGNIGNYINEIKRKDIKVIGTSLHTNSYLDTLEKLEEFAIIFGNEGNGISSEVLDTCDILVKIKMNELCESLNVGVSSGIVLYHMFKG